MDNNQKKYLPHLLADVRLLLCLGAAAFLLHLSGIGCPFRFFFGVPCAGCGMSRALFSLLRGHMAEAVAFHPLVMLMPAAFLVWLLREHFPKKMLKMLLAGLVAAFLATYLYRIFQGDPVLCFDLRNGFFLRFMREGIQYVL